ncbi:MAG TPA: hypothetical protein VFQ61_35655 [Polyangiaceae bacterium]|nr:hypothetical protein [Polyangiaceae bacterium]
MTGVLAAHIVEFMHRGAPYLLIVASFFGAAVIPACARYKPARTYEVRSQADPAGTYQVVQGVLKDYGYTIVAQDAAQHSVSVRSHAFETNNKRQSWIAIEVQPDGLVKLAGSGYLVRPDGSLHARLRNELDVLESKIQERLVALGPTTANAGSSAGQASSPGNATDASGTDMNVPGYDKGAGTGAPAASSNELPKAWSEPAYDPKVWGPGQFTCVPVHLSKSSNAFRLKLSNGEFADVLVSVAYAPELCRSPSECPLKEGCPAVGLGDNSKVSFLAQRLDRGEIQGEAILFDGPTPQVKLDLRNHGSIVQAQAASKTPAPAAKAPAPKTPAPKTPAPKASGPK